MEGLPTPTPDRVPLLITKKLNHLYSNSLSGAGLARRPNSRVPKAKNKTHKMSATSPITCHVLNTVTGTPASGLSATLTLLQWTPSPTPQTAATHLDPTSTTFTALTDNDGRIKSWTAASGSKTVQETLAAHGSEERTAWSITFATGAWYEERGTECFWPQVEVKFYVKRGVPHYHVPVLVGPWSYTTYRGS